MSGGPLSEIISHWYSLLDGVTLSSQEFYVLLEEEINHRELPDTEIGWIEWPEGGMFSARRKYLRITRKEIYFDVCAAPFGHGCFVSWWLGESPSGCLTILTPIPLLGRLIESQSRPPTYYRVDTALMFQEAVHRAVLAVVDSLTSAKGLRALSESERKPILRRVRD